MSPYRSLVVAFSALLVAAQAAGMGEFRPISDLAPEVSEFALSYLEKMTNNWYSRQIQEISDVQVQTVSGTMYTFTMILKTTDCPKSQRKREDECNFNEDLPAEKCVVKVWSKPWLDFMKVTQAECHKIQETEKDNEVDVLGGDDHDYKPHGVLGGGDHDYLPHGQHLLGGDDHDYQKHGYVGRKKPLKVRKYKVQNDDDLVQLFAKHFYGRGKYNYHTFDEEYAVDKQPKRHGYYGKGKYNFHSDAFRKNINDNKKIGGDDHDYKPHGAPLIGGDDHDYKPHGMRKIGGDDHDYKPHGAPLIGGDDHDYKPHGAPLIGGDDHDYKPHGVPLIGGDDHDYKPHGTRKIGGDDHDYKPHGAPLIGGDDHDYKPHGMRKIGGDDHDYKPHGAPLIGGDDHDYKPHGAPLIGGDDHDYKPHGAPLIGGDDHDYKSHGNM